MSQQLQTARLPRQSWNRLLPPRPVSRLDPLVPTVSNPSAIAVSSPTGPIVNDSKNIVRRKLTGYVGFANLPNQWHRKSVRKGFNFNVMVVGMSAHGSISHASGPAC